MCAWFSQTPAPPLPELPPGACPSWLTQTPTDSTCTAATTSPPPTPPSAEPITAGRSLSPVARKLQMRTTRDESNLLPAKLALEALAEARFSPRHSSLDDTWYPVPTGGSPYNSVSDEGEIDLRLRKLARESELSAKAASALLAQAGDPGVLRRPVKRRHRALLIGISYEHVEGVPNLPGAVNDLREMFGVLTEFIGYAPPNVRVLCDDTPCVGEVGQVLPPTRSNILRAMSWLVADSQAGDACFFFFAGHGHHVVDISGDEASGWDQVLFPLDILETGYILDDWIYERLSRGIAPGARLIAVVDACRSGTVFDLPVNWTYAEAHMDDDDGCSDYVSRAYNAVDDAKSEKDIFFDAIVRQASDKSGSGIYKSTSSLTRNRRRQEPENGQRKQRHETKQTTLGVRQLSLSGASTVPCPDAGDALVNQMTWLTAVDARVARVTSARARLTSNGPGPTYRRSNSRHAHAGTVVLFSGASDTQTTTDAPVEGDARIFQGVFTRAFLDEVEGAWKEGSSPEQPPSFGAILDGVKMNTVQRVRDVWHGLSKQVPQLSASIVFDIYDTPMYL
jgi:Caspase domain